MLNDNRVGEIVIVDDFSDDYARLLKIVSEIDVAKKVKIFRNSINMGAFKNNIIAATHCRYPWMILLDSDNIIDRHYIDILDKLHSWDPDFIYCPDWAIVFPAGQPAPDYNFTEYENQALAIYNIYEQHFEAADFRCLLNTGNYFFHRKNYLNVLWKYRDFDVPAFGSLVANTLWLADNYDHRLYVLKGLRYRHRIHPGSNFLNNAKHHRGQLERIQEYCKLRLLGKTALEPEEAINRQEQNNKTEILDDKAVVTMSTLGKTGYGRFANQLFQYGFLKTYSTMHDLQVETAEWIGKVLFGADDSPVSKKLPLVRQETYKVAEDHIPNAKVPYRNVDFGGNFQYHTSFYAPHKEYFRSLFKPVAAIERYMSLGYNKLKAMGNTIIGLHLRRGDYGYSHYFIAPTSWYLHWLDGYWDTLDKPVLFIASDEPEKVLDDVGYYSPVTCKSLGLQIEGIEYYPDFYMLSHCDILAISNSSFSFAAAMLNEKANVFFRPHLPTQKLIPFDPWCSETIFREAKEEDYLKRKQPPAPIFGRDNNCT